ASSEAERERHVGGAWQAGLVFEAHDATVLTVSAPGVSGARGGPEGAPGAVQLWVCALNRAMKVEPLISGSPPAPPSVTDWPSMFIVAPLTSIPLADVSMVLPEASAQAIPDEERVIELPLASSI